MTTKPKLTRQGVRDLDGSRNGKRPLERPKGCDHEWKWTTRTARGADLWLEDGDMRYGLYLCLRCGVIR